jgi:hypothetical protein
MWRHKLEGPFRKIVGTVKIRRNGDHQPHILTSSAFPSGCLKKLGKHVDDDDQIEATERSSFTNESYCGELQKS